MHHLLILDSICFMATELMKLVTVLNHAALALFFKSIGACLNLCM